MASNRGESRVLKECIMKQVENVGHQLWVNLQISKAKMTITGCIPGNIVLLVCISAIIAFDVLCTLSIFKDKQR